MKKGPKLPISLYFVEFIIIINEMELDHRLMWRLILHGWLFYLIPLVFFVLIEFLFFFSSILCWSIIAEIDWREKKTSELKIDRAIENSNKLREKYMCALNWQMKLHFSIWMMPVEAINEQLVFDVVVVSIHFTYTLHRMKSSHSIVSINVLHTCIKRIALKRTHTHTGTHIWEQINIDFFAISPQLHSIRFHSIPFDAVCNKTIEQIYSFGKNEQIGKIVLSAIYLLDAYSTGEPHSTAHIRKRYGKW